MARALLGGVLLVVLRVSTLAQESVSSRIPPDFDGVFQSIASDARTPGGQRNTGSPEDLATRSPEQTDEQDRPDPEQLCEPLGPFRMMAREGLRIELVPVPATGTIMILFEDLARGYVRSIGLHRAPQSQGEPRWQGYSAGRWEGSSLVVTTTGFNDRTWLNSKAVRHSGKLRLTERFRPIEGGRFLEYTATAEDPDVLLEPYTYVRYFQRTADEIKEQVCEV